MYYVKQLITAFTVSNLTETYPVWNPATTYTFQASSPTSASIARYGSWYYRSTVNSNLNFNPETYNKIKWSKYSVANSHALLDLKAQTKSILVGGDLSVTFTLPSICDVIGVGYFEGDTVTIELINDIGTVLWTHETISSYSSNVTSWYSWTFSKRLYEMDRSVAVKIPKYIGATKAKITINGFTSSTQTACGFLLSGESIYMGSTSSDIAFNYNSYTIRDKDDFGNVDIIRRPVEDTVDFTTSIPKSSFLQKQREIKRDLDSILMFVVDDELDESSMVVHGMMNSPSPMYDEFDISVISWSVTELV